MKKIKVKQEKKLTEKQINKIAEGLGAKRIGKIKGRPGWFGGLQTLLEKKVMDKKDGIKTIKGTLEAFWETGSEGVIWIINEEGKKGYDGFNCIEEGDYLTIYSKKKKIVWEGLIECDRKTRYRKHPLNLDFGQQEVCGYWVHWLPAGVADLEKWARYFFKGYFAELIKIKTLDTVL